MKAFPSASVAQSFPRLSIQRSYSYSDQPATESKPIYSNQESISQLYEPDQSSFKKITKDDPVYSYQNKSFDEIFGSSCVSPRVMSPTQSKIRKSIISVSERTDPSFSDDSPLTLEHVSSMDSISDRLDDLQSSTNALRFVTSAFRSLVEKHGPSDNEFDPLKYRYEIILKGIEMGNILNVIYLILGFDEDKQDAVNSKFTGNGSRLFNKDYCGKLRIETVNQKLLTINLSKLLLISKEKPFLFYKNDNYSFDRVHGFRLSSQQQKGTKRLMSTEFNSQNTIGQFKEYTDVTVFFDELISDLDQRNIHIFDAKVYQLNAFNFDQDQSLPLSPKRRFSHERSAFDQPIPA